MLPILTAEDAIITAEEFLSRYYFLKRPLDVQKQDDSWVLIFFDVGVLTQERVEIKIDATSRAVIGYTTPEFR